MCNRCLDSRQADGPAATGLPTFNAIPQDWNPRTMRCNWPLGGPQNRPNRRDAPRPRAVRSGGCRRARYVDSDE